ncbi:hypothetical protein SARC_07524 [Sphaeroforma arctica JP610]|uniref:Uncharacterized protein n=1 Tax=Sphaeroforma arctica JP610 TaxID=667725 RepID=A0A0L0FTI6_9EUKA|nr:hypothetical protein SARC_07524 [Sphaeroforma arctica JP610]KNC80102.1 hypothetical protein SARC_07524 [Sphaeroforma arctica JP610]|eukprot:XP_014154004.1 hypothetical protein SARC_07524 [Sphaeroforma arctica JP610]
MDEKEAFEMSLMLEPRVSTTIATDYYPAKKHARTGSTASTNSLLSPSTPLGKSSPPHSPKSNCISQSMNAIANGIESFTYDSLTSKISSSSADSLQVITHKHAHPESDGVSLTSGDSATSPTSPRLRKPFIFSSKVKVSDEQSHETVNVTDRTDGVAQPTRDRAEHVL